MRPHGEKSAFILLAALLELCKEAGSTPQYSQWLDAAPTFDGLQWHEGKACALHCLLNAAAIVQVPTNVLPIVVWLTEAYHYLARVQSKLHRHAEARSTLTQASDVLQSAVVIHALDALDASQTSARWKSGIRPTSDISWSNLKHGCRCGYFHSHASLDYFSSIPWRRLL